MAKFGRSVHPTTAFPGQVNQYSAHILSLLTENKSFGIINGREENGRRNLVMINIGPQVQASPRHCFVSLSKNINPA